jgi:hypothetical protein
MTFEMASFHWWDVEERSMADKKDRASRVRFGYGYPARIMAIDGTWSRDCVIEDISETGAKISITGAVGGLKLNEFFLALSRMGVAHRRCEMIWLTGGTMGIRFAAPKEPVGQKASRANRREAARET